MTLIFQNEDGVPYTEGLCSLDIDMESFRCIEYIAETENITFSQAFINLMKKSGLVKEEGTNEEK
jgi:hypothetical protein